MLSLTGVEVITFTLHIFKSLIVLVYKHYDTGLRLRTHKTDGKGTRMRQVQILLVSAASLSRIYLPIFKIYLFLLYFVS